jgi:hypothetical protein
LDFRNELIFFKVAAEVGVNDESPIFFGSQNAARVAVGLAAVGGSFALPVDASEGVTAAGFDDSVAVASGAESRPKSDVKRDGSRQGMRGSLEEARVHERGQKSNVESLKKVKFGVNEEGDFTMGDG